MAQKMANAAAKPDSLPLNLGAAMADGSTAGKVEVAGGSDRSISPEERSRTPDSGPNNDDEIVSESDSRKDASGTDPDGSPSSSLQKQSGMVEFVVDDFMEHIKEGGTSRCLPSTSTYASHNQHLFCRNVFIFVRI